MKNFYKPKTNLKIVYIEEEDFIVKQIIDDTTVIYDQRLIKSSVSEFTYDKVFFNEPYEKETNIANGFVEERGSDGVGKCMIQ